MRINLMLPTRERPNLCYRFCKSVKDTTNKLEDVFISIILDEDDKTDKELMNKLSEFNFIKFLPKAQVSSFPGLVYYWNKIIEQTINETDIFAMVGDDMIFRDNNWDLIIQNYFNNLKDKIGLIHFNSASPYGNTLCINSFIHKRYIEITGQYIDNRLKGDYSDNFLFYIFNTLNRIEYVSTNLIEHMHYDVGKMKQDNTGIRRRSVDSMLYEGLSLCDFFNNKSIPLANIFIEKLKKHML